MSDPRNMLPEEVWYLILNFVEDSLDILSCSQTCPLFESHLFATRTEWAFPSVFPLALQFLPKTDALQCRLVSKSWRKAVDNFLQSDQFAPTLVQHLRNDYDLFGNNFVSRIPKHLPPPLFVVNLNGEIVHWDIIRNMNLIGGNLHDFMDFQFEDLDAPDQLQEFVSIFRDNYKKNPFPSRAVVLVIRETDIENALLFLNTFGGHIWSLGIILKVPFGARQVIQLIWEFLNKVPNIKHVFIKHVENPGNEIYINAQKNLNKLTRTAPHLKLLKWVELKISNMVINDIIVKALDGKSVTILGLPGGIQSHNISGNGWKRLDLGRFGCETWEWDLRMMSLKHLHLPLEHITICMGKCDDLNSIFANLSKYGLTLRRLNLGFGNLEDGDFIEMSKQVDTIYSFLVEIKCLVSFNMDLICNKSTIEFRRFIDKILDADWIEKYLEIGGVMSGFRDRDSAKISAGLKIKTEEPRTLKRKYVTQGKYFRSMEMVEKKDNWFVGIAKKYFS